LFSGTAQAHRLEADYRVLPGKKVQVECWFDLTGDVPIGAEVQVFRPGQSLLTRGTADAKGVFVFPFDEAADLTVVVNAGAGHRKELLVPKSALLQKSGQSPGADGDPVGEVSTWHADRTSKIEVKDILTGLALLLALAAFVLSLRNARSLREFRQRPDGESFQ
jgi:hypothetical protein